MKALRLLALAAATTAGCSAMTPFVTSPLPAKPGVVDAGPRTAVCYNTLSTSADKVQELAQEGCLGNTVPQRVDTDYRLDDCPLSVPARATFVCAPKK
jgi:hypothetical protein